MSGLLSKSTAEAAWSFASLTNTGTDWSKFKSLCLGRILYPFSLTSSKASIIVGSEVVNRHFGANFVLSPMPDNWNVYTKLSVLLSLHQANWTDCELPAYQSRVEDTNTYESPVDKGYFWPSHATGFHLEASPGN